MSLSTSCVAISGAVANVENGMTTAPMRAAASIADDERRHRSGRAAPT